MLVDYPVNVGHTSETEYAVVSSPRTGGTCILFDGGNCRALFLPLQKRAACEGKPRYTEETVSIRHFPVFFLNIGFLLARNFPQDGSIDY